MPRKQRAVPLWRTLLTSPHHPSFLPLAAAVALAVVGARADDAALAPREVPAKSIPVPTDVSPGMQKFIAAPLNPTWHDLWKTGEE
jgi:monoterpene epsilon-lactone hydrolase